MGRKGQGGWGRRPAGRAEEREQERHALTFLTVLNSSTLRQMSGKMAFSTKMAYATGAQRSRAWRQRGAQAERRQSAAARRAPYLVLAVVDNVDELLREQPRVEGVEDAAGAGDAKPEVHVVVAGGGCVGVGDERREGAGLASATRPGALCAYLLNAMEAARPPFSMPSSRMIQPIFLQRDTAQRERGRGGRVSGRPVSRIARRHVRGAVHRTVFLVGADLGASALQYGAEGVVGAVSTRGWRRRRGCVFGFRPWGSTLCDSPFLPSRWSWSCQGRGAQRAT